MRYIGLALKVRRTMKRMTMQDLSNRCGLSVSYISLIERGQREPSMKVYLLLCTWLDSVPSEMMALAEQLEEEEHS